MRVAVNVLSLIERGGLRVSKRQRPFSVYSPKAAATAAIDTATPIVHDGLLQRFPVASGSLGFTDTCYENGQAKDLLSLQERKSCRLPAVLCIHGNPGTRFDFRHISPRVCILAFAML